MAMPKNVTPAKLVGVGALALASAYMGYTTLFPTEHSVYAQQNAQQASVETDVIATKQSTEPNDEVGELTVVTSTDTVSHQDADEVLDDVATQKANTPESTLSTAVNQALQKKLEQLSAPPKAVPSPVELNLDAKRYLNKSSSLALATLDAEVREQNQRSQPEKDTTLERLGLNAMPTVVTPVVPVEKASPKRHATLGSLVRIEGKHWQARLNVQGHWHKVLKGDHVGQLTILAINEQGVRVRDGKSSYWLTPGGQS